MNTIVRAYYRPRGSRWGLSMPLPCLVLVFPLWLAVLLLALPFIGVYQLVKQTRLLIARSKLPPAPSTPRLPPNYGLRSLDGRWWWDGQRWRPVQ